MNIEGLKLEFYNYLKQLLISQGKTSESEQLGELAEFSIFMHSNEFKQFVTDKFELSSDAFSMSVDDLMKLELQNGQLVDPSETETDPEINDFIDILNVMFEDDGFQDLYDKDNNGEISQEEFTSFLDAVKSLDGNAADLSMEDVIQSSAALEEEEPPEEMPPAETPSTESSQGPGGGGGVSSYSPSSTGGEQPASGADENPDAPDVPEKIEPVGDLSGKTSEDLSGMLNTANSQYSLAQNAVGGAEENLAKVQTEEKGKIDEAFKAYQDAINNNEEIEQEQKDAIINQSNVVKEAQDTLLADKDSQKLAQAQADEAQKTVDSQDTIIKDCESSISSLESKKAALSASLSSAEDSEKSSIQGQITQLNAQISALNQQKQAAEERKAEAEKELEEATQTVSELDAKIAEDEKALTDAQTELENLENELPEEAKEAINEAKAAYDEAVSNYEKNCVEAQTALDEARKTFDTARDNVEKISTAYNEAARNEAEAIEISDEAKQAGEEYLQELGLDDVYPENSSVDDEENTDASEEDADKNADDTEEKQKDYIEELCSKLNMSREEVGIYLKEFAGSNDISVDAMKEKIQEFIEEANTPKEETEQDGVDSEEDADDSSVEQYGIDPDRAEYFLAYTSTSYDSLEDALDNPLTMFELNILSEPLEFDEAENSDAAKALEEYNNLISAQEPDEAEISEFIKGLMENSDEYADISAEEKLKLLREISVKYSSQVSEYLNGNDSFLTEELESIQDFEEIKNFADKYVKLLTENSTVIPDETQLSKLNDAIYNNANSVSELLSYAHTDVFAVFASTRENKAEFFSAFGEKLYNAVENLDDYKAADVLVPLDSYIKQLSANESDNENIVTDFLGNLLHKISAETDDLGKDADAYGISEERAKELLDSFGEDLESWLSPQHMEEFENFIKIEYNEALFLLKNRFESIDDAIKYINNEDIWPPETRSVMYQLLFEIYGQKIS